MTRPRGSGPQFQTDEQYKTELRGAGFGTPEEYRRTLYEQFYRRALQQKAYEELKKTAVGRNVSDAEVQEAFDKNKATLQAAPASLTFRQIVVAPKPTEEARKRAKAKADSLLVEIKKGGDFEQIAKRESMDPGSKAQGGDLGWNRRGVMVPEFDRMMFALQPGQMSPVFESPFGFHIMRVDRVQAAEVKARHILIVPTIDSGDVAKARIVADTVAQLMKKGITFDSLVAKYHDPAEEKGILQPFIRDSLPAAYCCAGLCRVPGYSSRGLMSGRATPLCNLRLHASRRRISSAMKPTRSCTTFLRLREFFCSGRRAPSLGW